MPLHCGLPLYVILQIEVFTVKYSVGELRNPVAENHHPALVGKHQVEFNVAMPEKEVIDVRMRTEVIFGKKH